MHQDKDWRVTQVLVRRCVTATAPEQARLTISDSARRYFPLLTQIPWCLDLLNLFFLSPTLAPPCHHPAQCLHPSRHSAIPLTTPLPRSPSNSSPLSLSSLHSCTKCPCSVLPRCLRSGTTLCDHCCSMIVERSGHTIAGTNWVVLS